MQVGRQNKLVQIQQQAVSDSATGATVTTWVLLKEAWVNITHKAAGGREDLRSDTLFPQHNVTMTARRTALAGVNPTMRVVYDSQIYEIVNVMAADYNRNLTVMNCKLKGSDVGAPLAFSQDVENTDGVVLRNFTAFANPAVLLDIEVEDVVDIFGTFPQPTRIVVEGSTVDDVVVNPSSGEMTIETVCPFQSIAVKSTDNIVTLTTISSYPVGGVVNTADQRIRQQNNNVIQSVPYRTDVKITNADINSITQTTAFTEIEVVLPPPPSPAGIAYKVVAPMSMLPLTTGVNDSRALFISGWYDRTNPVYPVSYAEINSAATQADVRVTPATGTNLTDPIIHTILKHNNAFGNKLRFTDSLGRQSDATVGSDLYAHVNWLGHSFGGGAIDKYVIDHLTGDGYMIKFITVDGDYNLTNTAVGKTWADWMTAISNLNLAGFTDWKPLDCCTLRPHANKANLFESWAANFFISSRATGEIAGQTDNRVTFITGENANSLNFNALYDSGSSSTIFPNAKATSGGFAQIIANVFPIRRHYT
jgi:head-tail adaptor